MDLWMTLALVGGAVAGLLAGIQIAAMVRNTLWTVPIVLVCMIIGAGLGAGGAWLKRTVNASFYTPAAVDEVCKMVKPEAMTAYGLKACKT